MSGEYGSVQGAEAGRVGGSDMAEPRTAAERLRMIAASADQAVGDAHIDRVQMILAEAAEAVDREIEGLFAGFDDRVATVNRRLDAILQSPAAR